MSGKRPGLADAMRQAVQAEPPQAAEIPAPAVSLPAPRPVAPLPAKAGATTRPAGFYAATRAGKKKVTAALDPTTHKQLKGLAVDKEVTTEALLAEAISDLLTKHGVKEGE